MEETTICNILAVWSDLVSLLLLAICYLLHGLEPNIPVLDRRKFQFFRIPLTVTAAFAWTIFRFIYGGITQKTGPREFHTVLVVYIAHWLYLWFKLNWPNSKEARLLRAAQALGAVQMVRAGICGRDKSDPNKDRNEGCAREVVLRRGVVSKPAGKPTYWRGTKVGQHLHTESDVYEVHLADEGLHLGDLGPLCTIACLSGSKVSAEDTYRRIYNVVLTAVAYREATPQESAAANSLDLFNTTLHGGAISTSPASSGEMTGEAEERRWPAKEVDFRRFFEKWPGNRVDRMAAMVNATDRRDIGRIARRIAADAVHYVTLGGEFRTEKQVGLLNLCLQGYAVDLLGGPLLFDIDV